MSATGSESLQKENIQRSSDCESQCSDELGMASPCTQRAVNGTIVASTASHSQVGVASVNSAIKELGQTADTSSSSDDECGPYASRLKMKAEAVTKPIPNRSSPKSAYIVPRYVREQLISENRKIGKRTLASVSASSTSEADHQFSDSDIEEVEEEKSVTEKLKRQEDLDKVVARSSAKLARRSSRGVASKTTKLLDDVLQSSEVRTQSAAATSSQAMPTTVALPSLCQDALKIKVLLGQKILRYNVQLNKPISELIAQIASSQSVRTEQVGLFIGDRRLNYFDTANILGLTSQSQVDCFIETTSSHSQTEAIDLSDGDAVETDSDERTGKRISLKLQWGASVRNQYVTSINPADDFTTILAGLLKEEALLKLLNGAVILGFVFDGEEVDFTCTPADLDIENDDTLDCKLAQSGK